MEFILLSSDIYAYALGLALLKDMTEHISSAVQWPFLLLLLIHATCPWMKYLFNMLSHILV